MLLSAIVLGVVYPGAVQYFSVRPNEPDKERPYIERNIAATRAAYDVDDVEITDYSAKTTATAGQLTADAEALPGIRLIDPAVVSPAYDQLQQVRGYYTFPKTLDVDRYTIDGAETDAVVAVREMDLNGVEGKNWNNIRTVYTHGYGLVAAYGNRRQSGGEPEWIASDIPPTGQDRRSTSRGSTSASSHERVLDRRRARPAARRSSWTPRAAARAATRRPTPTAARAACRSATCSTGCSTRPSSPTSTSCCRTGSTRRPRSSTTGRRGSGCRRRRRGSTSTGTLPGGGRGPDRLDRGRLHHVEHLPLQPAGRPRTRSPRTRRPPRRATTWWRSPTTSINYMRNSVKAVVDAYDGTVKLYAWDDTDPVLQTWRKAFPGVVLDKAEISADLLDHLRYPQDMFKVQREILARYHMTDPCNWYQQSGLWEVPEGPGRRGRTARPRRRRTTCR